VSQIALPSDDDPFLMEIKTMPHCINNGYKKKNISPFIHAVVRTTRRQAE
jgi:hypothetical protein